MGVSADVTPQVARMDAHSLKRNGPVRLCYNTPVLRTMPDAVLGSRSPLQMGAELFGHGGVESDLEILNLMLATLKQAGARQIHLDLGHVGVFRGLMDALALDAELEAELFGYVQQKSYGEIDAFAAKQIPNAELANLLMRLCRLHGDAAVLPQARQVLAAASVSVQSALDTIEAIAQAVAQQHPDVELYFDFSELRGYNYHTGMVFAAYVPGYGQAIAKGGRYDETGKVFGRARPATGFTTDLKILSELAGFQPPSSAIFAPADPDEALQAQITELRAAGERVICELPGQDVTAQQMGCDRMLVKQDNQWAIQAL